MKKILVICSIVLILYFVYLYKTNYTPTIAEAINKTNIEYDEIYQTENINNRILIIYGLDKDEIMSVGLLKKNWLGYSWIFGSGSSQINKFDIPVSLAISNLPLENHRNTTDVVSIAFGTIYQDEIQKLNVIYKDQSSNIATIIETKFGRRWFSLSESPINGDPQIIGINKEGEEIYKNY